MAEILAAQQKAKFGSVKEISAVDYVDEVNKAGEGVWVVLHLYKPGYPFICLWLLLLLHCCFIVVLLLFYCCFIVTVTVTVNPEITILPYRTGFNCVVQLLRLSLLSYITNLIIASAQIACRGGLLIE